jgi:hypothetical protein
MYPILCPLTYQIIKVISNNNSIIESSDYASLFEINGNNFYY